MPVKFLGRSGEPPILPVAELKYFKIAKSGCQKNKPDNVNYFSDFVEPLVDRIENSGVFFEEAEYQ